MNRTFGHDGIGRTVHTPWLDKIILCRQPDFVVQIGLCRERSEQPAGFAREAARSAAERASEVRGSAPIELRQGSGKF